MYLLRILILTLLLGGLLIVAACDGRPVEGEDDLTAFADRVMEAVTAGDLAEAYGLMARHSVLPREEVVAAGAASVEQRGEAFLARYGRTTGYERVVRQQAGENLLRYIYLEQTERHPLVWVFDFYRSPGGWVLISFGWHDNVAVALDG